MHMNIEQFEQNEEYYMQVKFKYKSFKAVK